MRPLARQARAVKGALSALALCWAVPAHADVEPADAELEAEVVQLETVLDSVAAHHPLMRAEIEAVQAARGEQMRARGAYDPAISVKGSVAPAGYYDYRTLDAQLSQLTPLWGAELYAGYRVQDQNLPSYYGELATLDRGEVRAGLSVPLWKGRAVDAARAGRRTSDAELAVAEGERDVTLLDLQRAAAAAYYAWTAAQLDRAVQTELLELARARIEQVRGKVREGALPAIEELDNERALLSREAKLIDVQRKLEQSRIKLGLYLRDAEGRMAPPRGDLAPALDLPDLEPDFDAEERVERAIEDHPLVASYAAQLRAAEVMLALAENAVAPDLSVGGEVSKDFGGGDDDQLRSLSPTYVRLKATFKVPLALREARGKRAAASAKLRALRAKADYARDKLRAEVLQHAAALRAAVERAERTRRMAEVAERLAEGERERFALGATTLVWVNTREKTAADAKIDAIHAVAEARVELAAYRTALGLPPL